MSGIELKTAKYFESPEDELTATSGTTTDQSSSLRESSTASWERVTKWISLGAAGLVILCLVLVAVPYVTGIRLPKSASPMDWWLWFGGAKSDQTFEKFVRDTATKNPMDWDEKYRQSPMYQFKGIQPLNLNQMPGGQLNSQPSHR
jgi:hypothetical protein